MTRAPPVPVRAESHVLATNVLVLSPPSGAERRRRRCQQRRQQHHPAGDPAAGQLACLRRRQRKGLDHAAAAGRSARDHERQEMIELEQQEMTDKSINVIVAHDDAVEGPWVSEHITHSSDIVVDEVLGSLAPGSDALHHTEADVLVVACGVESNRGGRADRVVGRPLPRPAGRGAVSRTRPTDSCSARSRPEPTTWSCSSQARTCQMRPRTTSRSRCTRRSCARSRPASRTHRSRR